jgi:hypothetical protein
VFEPSHAPLASRRHFLRRVTRHALAALLLLAVSLVVGMWGYWYFEGLEGLDAFLNAAMLLGGMGPLESPRTPGGKLFAGLYALYAGMVVLVAAGVLLAPVLHRFLHRFHLESRGDR